MRRVGAGQGSGDGWRLPDLVEEEDFEVEEGEEVVPLRGYSLFLARRTRSAQTQALRPTASTCARQSRRLRRCGMV